MYSCRHNTKFVLLSGCCDERITQVYIMKWPDTFCSFSSFYSLHSCCLCVTIEIVMTCWLCVVLLSSGYLSFHSPPFFIHTHTPTPTPFLTFFNQLAVRIFPFPAVVTDLPLGLCCQATSNSNNNPDYFITRFKRGLLTPELVSTISFLHSRCLISTL